MQAQTEEIQKFIWCLGVEIGHDPRQEHSDSELGLMWVSQYAGDFSRAHRKEYEYDESYRN